MNINKRKSETWFTADQHFGHESRRGGIIKYCKRPFTNIGEMDQHLIDAWNNIVEPHHQVIHLGDFTLGENAAEYFKQLNGHIFILGMTWHHDRHWLNPYLEWYDFSIKSKNGVAITVLNAVEVLEAKNVRGYDLDVPITLCHYPLAEWDRKHYGAYHLHGHSHGKYKGEGRILDVGVDNIYKLSGEYRPIRLDEVIEYMKRVKGSFWEQLHQWYIPPLQKVCKWI